jgi:hypothetical protein
MSTVRIANVIKIFAISTACSSFALVLLLHSGFLVDEEKKCGKSYDTTEKLEMQQCIQNRTDCHHMCVETRQHCLQMEGKHADPTHIRLMLDCAEIYQTSANFMIRGSDLHAYTCTVCAEVCDLCAEDCEHVGPGDE